MLKRQILLVLLFCFLFPLQSFAHPGHGHDPLLQKAKQFLNQINQKKYSVAITPFTAAMKKAFPAQKLGMTWSMIQLQVGLFEYHHSTKVVPFRGFKIYKMLCKFQRAWLTMRVVFDGASRIAGLQFRPAKAPASRPSSKPSTQASSKGTSQPSSRPTSKFTYHVPSYAKPGKFTELEMKFGIKGRELPGTLTLPKGAKSSPIVILVHGSGAHDRDETVGPNKPFRDLAWGLASRGIAVFRYVKRSKIYAKEMVKLRDKLTIKEVTIDDAVAAAELLRKTNGIDPKRVYVLGHSLGGYALPRIGQKATWLAGLISVAGPSRPLEDLIMDQMTYVLGLDGDLSEKDAKVIAKLEVALANVKSPDLKPTTPPKTLPLGMPASFWLDMRKHSVTKIAQFQTIPMLFIHGGRDYQVTMDDLKGWKAALKKRTNVQYKVFPALNHLMMQGKGKSKPVEYLQQGHVDLKVIQAIANWMTSF